MGNSLQTQIPGGTWSGSAENTSFNRDTGLLVTMLRARDGSLKQASIVATRGMVLDNNDGKFNVLVKGEYFSSNVYSSEKPAGNWSDTASDVTFVDSVLSGNLRKCDGSYAHSSIVVIEGMSVENFDGCFVVTKQSRDRLVAVQTEKPRLPLGSWIQSARHVRISSFGNIVTVTAELQNTRGQWCSNEYKFVSSKIPVLGNNDGKFSVDMEDCSNMLVK